MIYNQLTLFDSNDYINQAARQAARIRRKAEWLRKRLLQLAVCKVEEVVDCIQLSLLKLKPKWWETYEGLTDAEVKAARKHGKKDRACELNNWSQGLAYHSELWESLF